MVWLFKRTTAIEIVGLVLVVGILIAGIALDEPIFPIVVCEVFVILGVELVATSLSVNLYSEHLDTANTDIETFLVRNRRLYKRARKKTKQTILYYEIIILRNYRRINQAQELLAEYLQIIKPDDYYERFLYICILMSLDILRRDFSHMNAYIDEERALIASMREKMVNPKLMASAEDSLERLITEAEFCSRSLQRLRNEDIALPQRYLQLIGYSMGKNKDIKFFKKCCIMNDDFCAGVAYAVLGNEQKAREYMQKVVSTGYKYPSVARAAQYLSTGDAQLLIEKPKLY